jgi:hypothetical protein
VDRGYDTVRVLKRVVLWSENNEEMLATRLM